MNFVYHFLYAECVAGDDEDDEDEYPVVSCGFRGSSLCVCSAVQCRQRRGAAIRPMLCLTAPSSHSG